MSISDMDLPAPDLAHKIAGRGSVPAPPARDAAKDGGRRRPGRLGRDRDADRGSAQPASCQLLQGLRSLPPAPDRRPAAPCATRARAAKTGPRGSSADGEGGHPSRRIAAGGAGGASASSPRPRPFCPPAAMPRGRRRQVESCAGETTSERTSAGHHCVQRTGRRSSTPGPEAGHDTHRAPALRSGWPRARFSPGRSSHCTESLADRLGGD